MVRYCIHGHRHKLFVVITVSRRVDTDILLIEHLTETKLHGRWFLPSKKFQRRGILGSHLVLKIRLSKTSFSSANSALMHESCFEKRRHSFFEFLRLSFCHVRVVSDWIRWMPLLPNSDSGWCDEECEVDEQELRKSFPSRG